MSGRRALGTGSGSLVRGAPIGALLLAGAVVGLGLLYVLGTAGCGPRGFPLDDGWIHQTYARNLAQSGRFAFAPGEASAGSTAPLWTLALALGHLIRLSPVAWSHVLGGGCLALSAWTAGRLARRLFPEHAGLAGWVSAACLLEWHLVWAAFSGMETILFSWLSLLLIERTVARSRPLLLGAIGGLLILTRPEGVVLVVLLALTTLVDSLRGAKLEDVGRSRGRLWSALAFLSGLALLLVPYLVSNVALTGRLLPNTFYAKQAEYAALLDAPVWKRLWRVARPTLVGAQVLLVPGALLQLAHCLGWRALPSQPGQRAPGLAVRLLPAAWWGAYLMIYALRMPVDYQHGRYVMPTIPFLLLYGLAGTARWLQPHATRWAVRVASRALPAAFLCLGVAFLLLGRQAYVEDVCIINGEMVQVAQWLRDHTPADALVAAHDIGAIGYVSQRSLIDLAGLVTPEVIPYIRDEARLRAYVLAQGADYMATFPSWYPEMTRDPRFVLVYQTDLALTRRKGGDNMAVYEIRRGGE
ncbi:MAG: hypothetical protein JXA09_02315 [Anaerolineae bacterium]|nr:hypothetical protein [Anaerolineae bacterium]